VLEHLVDEELSLAVGVARVDDRCRRFEQFADHRELLLRTALGLRFHQPVLRKDGQVLHAPDLAPLLRLRNVVGQVGVGLGLLEKMAEAPGDDHVVSAVDEPVATARHAELGGDGLGNGGLFGDEELHEGSVQDYRSSVQISRSGRTARSKEPSISAYDCMEKQRT